MVSALRTFAVSSGPIARSGSVAPSLQDPEEWSILARDKRPFLIFTWPTQEFLTRNVSGLV